MGASLPSGVTVRTELRPGDLGEIVRFHGVVYAREYGFDTSFEAYVAEPLARFVRSRTDRERLWIAERAGDLAGCIAIVRVSDEEAQLRWFLVDPSARGIGLGRYLLNEAMNFAAARDYRSVVLWTVSAMSVARRMYASAGFRREEERPVSMWGTTVVEEKYRSP